MFPDRPGSSSRYGGHGHPAPQAHGALRVWATGAAAVAQDRPVHALLVAVATVPLAVRR